MTSIQGTVSFPQVDSFLSALGSGSWGSISLVPHLPKIQGSLPSGVGHLCTCPSRCSLVTKDPETLAWGPRWLTLCSPLCEL